MESFDKAKRDRFLLCALFLVTVVGIVFWQLRSAEFLSWDDGILVTENLRIVKGGLDEMPFFWQHGYQSIYMPLTYSLWLVVAQVARIIDPVSGIATLDPHVFHTLNLVLHLANTLLVFALLKTIVAAFGHQGRVRDISCLVGTLLFALHPLQVESVAWISELKGLLATFFSCLALLYYLRFLEVPTGNAEARSGLAKASPRKGKSASLNLWLVATVFFACALLSKPAAVVVPVLALCLAVWAFRRSPLQALVSLAAWFPMALLLVHITRQVQSTNEAYYYVPILWRSVIAGDAIGFYLAKLFYPVNFTINYGRTPQWVLAQPWALSALIVPILLLIVAFLMRVRRPWVTLGIAVLFVALLPNIGFVPFQFQTYSTTADRYFYFAFLGPALILSCFLANLLERHPDDTQTQDGKSVGESWQRFPRHWIPPLTLCALLFCALGALSFRQTKFWLNDANLYAHALEVNPRDWAALSNRAVILHTQGRNDEAIQVLKKVMEIWPRAGRALNLYGLIRREQGNLTEAESLFRRTLVIAPDFSSAHVNLGITQLRQGKPEAALASFTKAIKYDAGNGQAYFYAAQILQMRGKTDEALILTKSAIELNNDMVEAHLLAATLYVQKKENAAAIREYLTAIKLDPTSYETRHDLALLLLSLGRRNEAIGLLHDALNLKPNDARLKRAMNAALASKQTAPVKP